jgi:hypothetical protein
MSLGLRPWKELTQFLEGHASQSLERTKVANQGESEGLFANKQGEVFHADNAEEP